MSSFIKSRKQNSYVINFYNSKPLVLNRVQECKMAWLHSENRDRTLQQSLVVFKIRLGYVEQIVC